MIQVELFLNFKREAKQLIKKYYSLAEELQQLIQLLSVNPYQGEPLGEDCYKIRIAIASKAKESPEVAASFPV